MSTTINLPVLLAQLPHLQQVAGAEVARPEAQAAFNEHLASENEKLEKGRVKKVEQPERLDASRSDPDGSRGGSHHPRGRRKPEEQAKPAEEEPSTPWSGQIVNRKV